MAKTFIKKKAGKNQTGPKYRTSDFFKGKLAVQRPPSTIKFNPARFRIQHKG